MKDKTKLFKALSDPNRLRVLKMLQAKPMCVCEITHVLDLATSTVSKHLRILRDAGFIIERKDGKWINFLINPRPDDPRISSFLSMLDFWIDNEAAIAKDKEKMKTANREKLCGR